MKPKGEVSICFLKTVVHRLVTKGMNKLETYFYQSKERQMEKTR